MAAALENEGGLSDRLSFGVHLYKIYPLEKQQTVMDLAFRQRLNEGIEEKELDNVELYARFPFLEVTHANSAPISGISPHNYADMKLWQPFCFVDMATNTFVIDCRALRVPQFRAGSYAGLNIALALQRILELCLTACAHFRIVALVNLSPPPSSPPEQVPEQLQEKPSKQWYPFFVRGKNRGFMNTVTLWRTILSRCALERQHNQPFWSRASEIALNEDIRPQEGTSLYTLTSKIVAVDPLSSRLGSRENKIRWVSDRVKDDSKTSYVSSETGYGSMWSNASPAIGPVVGKLMVAYNKLKGTGQTEPSEAGTSRELLTTGYLILRGVDTENEKQFEMPCLPFSDLEPLEWEVAQAEPGDQPPAAPVAVKSGLSRPSTTQLRGAPVNVMVSGKVIPREVFDNCFMLVLPGVALSVGFPITCAVNTYDFGLRASELLPPRSSELPEDAVMAKIRPKPSAVKTT
jgi:hypothetical protein